MYAVAVHQHHALDHRVVAGEDGVDGELAEAGQHEDLLGDDRAGDQRAQLQPDDGGHDDEAVAQRVPEHDLAARPAPWPGPCARSRR